VQVQGEHVLVTMEPGKDDEVGKDETTEELVVGDMFVLQAGQEVLIDNTSTKYEAVLTHFAVSREALAPEFVTPHEKKKKEDEEKDKESKTKKDKSDKSEQAGHSTDAAAATASTAQKPQAAPSGAKSAAATPAGSSKPAAANNDSSPPASPININLASSTGAMAAPTAGEQRVHRAVLTAAMEALWGSGAAFCLGTEQELSVAEFLRSVVPRDPCRVRRRFLLWAVQLGWVLCREQLGVAASAHANPAQLGEQERAAATNAYTQASGTLNDAAAIELTEGVAKGLQQQQTVQASS